MVTQHFAALPDFFLEVRSWFSSVRNLQLRGSILDAGEVGHGVPYCGGPVGPSQHPPGVGAEPGALHFYREMTSSGREDVFWFWIEWESLPRSCSQEDCSPPGLGHSVLTSLQDTKAALVPHLDKGPDAEFQHHALLVTGKVPDILQDEVLWPVILAVAEVGGDQAVLELAVLPVVEPVHPREPLTGWTPTQQVHLPPLEDPLPPAVGLAPLNGLPEEQVAGIAEDAANGAVWVVELLSLGC